MLRAFIDDSGSGGDSTWYVLAGYVGTVEGWDSFDAQWLSVLKQHPSINYFKASEAESLRPNGQWAGVTEKQRDSKLDALIAVIQKCARVAIYIRVRQSDYDAVIKHAVSPMWDNPYFFLFGGFITCAVGLEKHFGQHEPIDFVFDSHERFENPSKRLHGQMREMDYFAGRIVNVHYEDDKEFLPLQAADLLAWQVRRAFCVPKEPRRPQFESARSCDRPHFPYIMSRKDLEVWLDAMEKRAREYAASLGVPLETVQPWKRTKR